MLVDNLGDLAVFDAPQLGSVATSSCALALLWDPLSLWDPPSLGGAAFLWTQKSLPCRLKARISSVSRENRGSGVVSGEKRKSGFPISLTRRISNVNARSAKTGERASAITISKEMGDNSWRMASRP